MVDFTSFELLKKSVNKQITIKGIISEIPWQHLVGSFTDYPFSEYFDLEDGFQIIIYSRNKINNKNTLEIKGKVVVVSGRSKRPVDQEEKYEEYHLLVDSVKSIKN